IGQRDHSWGIRDHGRCPLWLWFQIQLDDGFLGVWHWEFANGARVYTDGCWAGADGSDPVPVIDFRHDLQWRDADGEQATYGADVTTTVADLTPAFLTEVLAGVTGGAAVTAVDPALVGTGQLGECVRLTLTYDRDTAAPTSLVAKLPSTDDNSRAAAAVVRA